MWQTVESFREMLIAMQTFHYCQLPVSWCLTFLTDSAAKYNPSRNHIDISKEIDL